MNMTRRGVLSAAVAALLAQSSGCSREASSAGGDQITIHLDESSFLYLPVYFAIDNRYFADEGLRVEVVYDTDAGSIRSALGHSSGSIVAAHPADVVAASQSGGTISVIGQIVGHAPLHVLGPPREAQSIIRFRVPAGGPDSKLYEPWVLGGTSAAADEPPQIIPFESLADIDWQQPADEVLVVGEPASAIGVAAGAQIRRSAARDLSPHCYRVLAMDAADLDAHNDSVKAFLRAMQRAMTALQADPQLAIDTASARFPDLDEALLEPIVIRLLSEEVYPGSVLLSNDAWSQTLADTGHDTQIDTNIRQDSRMLRSNE